jgi:DNA-binding NarL/FixJ family response regulator
MQPTLSLPSANGLAPEHLAPRRVAVVLADRGLAATLVAELALTPGLAPARRGEAPDLLITDERDLPPGRRVLVVGDAAARHGVSTIAGNDVKLIVAAARVVLAGYRLERDAGVQDAAATPVYLTARERQVAELLVDGASNKVIARRLDISVHTAKFHVGAVLEKLGARNRSDAVAIALRDGLVAL